MATLCYCFSGRRWILYFSPRKLHAQIDVRTNLGVIQQYFYWYNTRVQELGLQRQLLVLKPVAPSRAIMGNICLFLFTFAKRFTNIISGFIWTAFANETSDSKTTRTDPIYHLTKEKPIFFPSFRSRTSFPSIENYSTGFVASRCGKRAATQMSGLLLTLTFLENTI